MIHSNFWEPKRIKLHTGEILFVEEFFNSEKLYQVQQIIKNLAEKEGFPWNKPQAQEELPRRTLKLGAVPELTFIVEHLNSHVIKEKFCRLLNMDSIGFIEGNLWEDSEGFEMAMHEDNEHVNCSMQIYIGDEIDLRLGTSLGHDSGIPFTTLPYIKNTGYILTRPQNLKHGMLTPVPAGFKRYSLYFYFPS